MNKFAATCGNLDFNSDQFQMDEGCISLLGGGVGGVGGYYTPVITQPTPNQITFSFTPSSADLPPIQPVTFTIVDQNLTDRVAALEQKINNMPVYNGANRVIPSGTQETVLDTSNKLVEQDITVEKIPYLEAENTSGGDTVTIA